MASEPLRRRARRQERRLHAGATRRRPYFNQRQLQRGLIAELRRNRRHAYHLFQPPQSGVTVKRLKLSNHPSFFFNSLPDLNMFRFFSRHVNRF